MNGVYTGTRAFGLSTVYRNAGVEAIPLPRTYQYSNILSPGGCCIASGPECKPH